MSFLVRKFQRQKWPNDPDRCVFDIASDVLTESLKTKGNTLSLWEVDSLDQLDNAILALVGSMQNLATMDIMIIEKEIIERLGIQIEECDGVTSIESLKHTHRNLIDLNYFSIGLIAEVILRRITSDTYCRRITEKKLKDKVRLAIDDGKILLEQLPPPIAKTFE